MIEMQRRFGFARFMTGVQPGNAASEALCERIGLRGDGGNILTCVDPAVIAGGSMTK